MKKHLAIVGAGLALLGGPAIGSPSECELADIATSRALHQALSLRAVDLVRRAATQDGRLTELVIPVADFSLGAGDVGRPLGAGTTGARQLAQLMQADTYRFLGWDYMDSPVDACAKHKVEVEFIDTQAKRLSRVEFTFEGGRVLSAVGWQRTFETGRIADAPAN